MRHSMRWTTLGLGIALAGAGAGRAAEETKAPPPMAEQVAAALQAAPEDRRDGAWVYGYEADGSFSLLREGTNDLVCLADDPAGEGFSVACYHRSLEPFMARGRELRAAGVTDREEVTRIRYEEAESGELAMPEKPATLYVLRGSGFDAAEGTVADPYLRWVIYTPWATPESTGLALNPDAPGAPWLMFPGTPGAHIMITPPPPAKPGDE